MALLDAAPHTASGPTLFGVPMKQVSLITLTFQNSALILLLHYSRVMPGVPSDHRYFASTAVFLSEALKLAISLTFAIYQASRTLAITPQTPATELFGHIYRSVFWSGDSWKLAIPATLYTLQNTLQYVALGNLDPVHFQVLYQLKILSTAFFSVVLLGRSLTPRRWASLVALTLGVCIVALSGFDAHADSSLLIHDLSDHFFPRSMHELGQAVGAAAPAAAHELTRRSATYEGIDDDVLSRGFAVMNPSLGVSAVLVAVGVSGLTGVYFEKVLKDSAHGPVSVWTRNIQLSFYSLFPAVFGILYNDGADIAQHGFFYGYNWVVWTVVVLQAVGGILTSLCINYADNIAKNFATSISFVIGILGSLVFFGLRPTGMFATGTLLVVGSVYLYTSPDRKRGRPPPINVVRFEKAVVEFDRVPGDDTQVILNPHAAHGKSHRLEPDAVIGIYESPPSTPPSRPSPRRKSREE